MKTQLDINILRSMLAEDFGLQIDNFSEVDPKDLGDHSDVYFGFHNGQKVFIKIGDDSRLRHFQIEIAALELLRQSGIPCAKTIGFKEKSKFVERPVVIQTAVSGTAMNRLKAEQKNPVIWEAAGRILRRINSIKLDGFGGLNLENGRLRGQYINWKEYTAHLRPDLFYLAGQGFLSGSEMKKIESAFANISNIDMLQASFLHTDFHGAHIFTDGKEITGVIDLAGASVGDPRYDIAIAHFYLSPEDRVAFNHGYGNAANDPLVASYHLLVATGKVEYRHKKGFTERIPKAVEVLKKSLE